LAASADLADGSSAASSARSTDSSLASWFDVEPEVARLPGASSRCDLAFMVGGTEH
jgi:hypothetical protein